MYAYDLAGNVTSDGTHTYTYDGESRVVSIDGGATAQMSYDIRNCRYKKVTGTGTTYYIWETGHVIAEYDGTGSVIADYVYANNRMIAKVSGSVTQYFLSDRLSVRLSLDASGNVLGRQAHLPYGEDFAESGTQDKHHFTGYEGDSETGTDYGVNRQYSQVGGRFGRPDPFAGSMSMANPVTLNRYAYTSDDPINHTDPSGLIGPGCPCGFITNSDGSMTCLACPPAPPDPGGIVILPPPGPTTSGITGPPRPAAFLAPFLAGS